MTLYLDFHILQSVAPSNLNRDDNGSPKTAIYGGVERHRVSSQAWKKAVRDDFSTKDLPNKGIRTKNVYTLILPRLKELLPEATEDELQAKTISGLSALGLAKVDKKTGDVTSDALVLLSQAQLDLLAEKIAEDAPSKDIKAALNQDSSLDLSLFGRMVASATELQVEASTQVAHSISTHAHTSEYDFFTAVDDFPTVEHAGSAMMGDVEFASSTLYRYASLNVDLLKKNLGDVSDEVVADGVVEFLDSFVNSIPTGKQNTFASHTLPFVVLVTVRSRPLNYVDAFETPVRSDKQGYNLPSITALVKKLQEVNEAYADESPKFATVTLNEAKETVGTVAEILPLPELKNRVREYVGGTLN